MDTYQLKTRHIQTATIRHQKARERAMNTLDIVTNTHKLRGDTSVVRRPKARIPVICMDCSKKFQTTKDIPECPKCGGTDIEVR